jgi:PAS domain S-box-containing protein
VLDRSRVGPRPMTGAPHCRRTQPAGSESLEFPCLMQTHSDPAGFLAVISSKDGLISSLSSSAEQLTGYLAQDLLGQPITHIMADRSAFEAPRMFDSARSRGLWEGEITHRSRSGKLYQAKASLIRLDGRDEILSGFLLVSILARPAASDGEDTAIGEVAAKLRRISHEINNPLAVITGFAQLILLNAECEGQIRDDMEKLYSELKRVIQAIEELHGYAAALQGTQVDGQAAAEVSA